jgi:2-polyprenyl-3-methyl-5-hydroxy-6-metoxy-1,4-benzoquinol methylase
MRPFHLAQHTPLTSPRVHDTAERRKVTVCNLCNGASHKPFCPENKRGLVQCENCGLVFVAEQPDAQELYALYGETYFQNEESGEVGYTNYIADEANIRQTANKRFGHIEKFVEKGRMIDVGCAMGFFVDEAAKRGWQVEALDISQFATEYVQKNFGHKAHNGSLLALDLPSGAYDLVTMWDVIEHVPDPQGYLERVAELLRAGGVVELATPDVGSLPAQMTGKQWIGYKLSDEHVYYFSVKTLSAMLEKAGFEVLHVRHVGKFVTLRLFLDRLGFYVPLLAKPLQWLEKTFKLSSRSFYVNPFDIVAITAKKR